MFQNLQSDKIQEGYQCIESVEFQDGLANGGRFSSRVGDIDISFYTPGIIRLQINKKDKPDYGLLSSFEQNIEIITNEFEQGFLIESGYVVFKILSNPFRIVLKRGNQTLLESVTDRAFEGNLRWFPFAKNKDSWLVSFALRSGEAVFGLGEKFGPLDKRGHLIEAWNQDATTVNTELSYKNIPFAWSPTGWGVFIHTTAKVNHAVGYPQWSHRSYILQVFENDLDLFLIAAETPAEMLEKYTYLTGRTKNLPRWCYGTWMSRAYYRTAEEVSEVSKKLRDHQIPCDVLVLDGRSWHKMETRFDFEWDRERYPDPAKFINQIRRDNFRLCLWEYPYVSVKSPHFTDLAKKGYFLKDDDGEPYIHRWFPYPFDTIYPHLQPSGIVDFTNPDAYEWYFQSHKSLFELGISVMKTDYGESIPEDIVAFNGDSGSRLHNVYSLLYNQCVYEATQKYSEDGAIVWGRAGWVGSQRYPLQWGGDPQIDWEGLAASIRGGLSYGMSGGAYYSHDIGGFAVGNPPSDLFIRWAQAGVMMSHTRFHGLGQREPWFFGEKAEEIIKNWLRWRYQLIPYLQACGLEAVQTGLPVMRSMPLSFPEDPSAWSFEEQYMLGPSLLVVPVLVPENKVRFYLPAGKWHDIWGGECIEGPKLIEETIPLEIIPVFGREGTILPLGPAVQHTGELMPELHLEEIWSFGDPEVGIDLPGLTLTVEGGKIKNIPDGVQLKRWEKK